jgi:FMN phosphatase YigB (HAD superfamily)
MHSPNGIKTILYDLDGTLRFNVPSGRDFFLDHAAAIGLRVSGEDRRRVALWEHGYWAESPGMLRDMAEQTTPEAFWLRYSALQFEALGIPAEQARELAPEMHRFMRQQYHPQDKLLPGVVDVLAQLRGAGFTLGVVSNRGEPFGAYLAEVGLGELVDFSVSGGEAGAKKPARAIFEYALRQAGSGPRRRSTWATTTSRMWWGRAARGSSRCCSTRRGFSMPPFARSSAPTTSC